MNSGDRILHIGCGWDRSAVVQPYIGRCHVVGVDLVTRGAEGYPGEFWRADAVRLPFGALTFDLACSELRVISLVDGAAIEEIEGILGASFFEGADSVALRLKRQTTTSPPPRPEDSRVPGASAGATPVRVSLIPAFAGAEGDGAMNPRRCAHRDDHVRSLAVPDSDSRRR